MSESTPVVDSRIAVDRGPHRTPRITLWALVAGVLTTQLWYLPTRLQSLTEAIQLLRLDDRQARLRVTVGPEIVDVLRDVEDMPSPESTILLVSRGTVFSACLPPTAGNTLSHLHRLPDVGIQIAAHLRSFHWNLLWQLVAVVLAARRGRAFETPEGKAILAAGGFLAVEIALRIFPTVLPAPVQPAAQMRWVSQHSGVFRFFADYHRLWEPDDWLRERIRPGVDTVLRGAPEYPEWPLRTDNRGLGPAGFHDTSPDEPPCAIWTSGK